MALGPVAFFDTLGAFGARIAHNVAETFAHLPAAEFEKLVLAIASCTGIESYIWLRDMAGCSQREALEKALALGKSKDAIYLPGWCGPASDD